MAPARTRRAWIALCLAVLLVSGHTAGLQIIAWAGMLAARLQTSTVEQAVRSTFDGSDPCRLCLAVSALKAADDLQAPDKAPAKPTKPMKQDAAPELMPGEALVVNCSVIALDDRRTLPAGDIPTSAVVAVELPPPRA